MNEQFVALSRANLSEFVDLYQTVFNAPPWSDGWTKDAVTERLTTFVDFPTFHGLGLICKEKPTALVLGWGERWVKGWTFHVKEMCVHCDWQRRGLGRQLMTAFERRLLSEGFHSVELQTGEGTPAYTFYESHGFAGRDWRRCTRSSFRLQMRELRRRPRMRRASAVAITPMSPDH